MKIQNRSRLKIAAQIILIPSILSVGMAWCGRDNIDTDHKASVNAQAIGPVAVETTVATTQTTATTATLATSVTTTTQATTTAMIVPMLQPNVTSTTTAVGTRLVPIPKVVHNAMMLMTSTTTTTTSTNTPTETQNTSTTAIDTPTIVVYKPSTHYIHTNKCRWYNSSCYEISDTSDIEARKCTECNPDMEILNEYTPPTTATQPPEPEPTVDTTTEAVSDTECAVTVSDYDRQLLAEIVWHEAGSNWISQYNKAKVAAGVMNRVYDSRFPDTVYGVLTARGQFSGYYPGCCNPTQACYDAVDYYLSYPTEFNDDNSWYGDGRQNHFYHI